MDILDILVSKFIPYMVFSSVESIAVLTLMYSIFSLRYNEDKRGFIILALIQTTVSFILVITETFQYIPIPIVFVVIIATYLKLYRGFNIYFSILVPVVGSIVFAIVQLTVIMSYLFSNHLDISEVQTTFSLKSYTIQTICNLVALFVAYFLRFKNLSFGLSLDNRTNNFYSSIFPLVMFLLCTYGIFLLHLLTNEFAILIIFCLLMIGLLVFLALFLIEREKIEYRIVD